ncbi:MAG: CPBP family intramembrane metalloprotease [Alphaproteobacteria bacterium]|nr:CPBP family intramembrane metalloprotease [Alphaproteobacteria bacterium]
MKFFKSFHVLSRNPWLTLEFLLICIVLPTVIIVFRFAPFMFFFLWGTTALTLLIFRYYHFTSWQNLWRWEAVTWAALRPILIRWVVCCIGMLVFTWLYDPDKLFRIIQQRPQIIPFLMVGYPLLSALPQEFIFCTYFFDRFKLFFQTQRAMILASALVFAYAHMLFINWVAPVFGFIAGLIFAQTYARSRSLALVTIEHGLYGNALFLIGLGWYFWHGAVEVGDFRP